MNVDGSRRNAMDNDRQKDERLRLQTGRLPGYQQGMNLPSADRGGLRGDLEH